MGEFFLLALLQIDQDRSRGTNARAQIFYPKTFEGESTEMPGEHFAGIVESETPVVPFGDGDLITASYLAGYFFRLIGGKQRFRWVNRFDLFTNFTMPDFSHLKLPGGHIDLG